MEHTPGPWKAISNGHYFDITVAEKAGGKKIVQYGPGIACVIQNDNYDHTRGHEVEKANALLMAAAPCLLSALKTCREALGDNLSKFDYKNEPIMLLALKKADAAIAKAAK